jgi:hypothetical protein
MYKRILLAYDGSVEGRTAPGKAPFWRVSYLRSRSMRDQALCEHKI